VLVQLRQGQFRTPRVLTFTEGNTEATEMAMVVEVRRSPQAVACRKRYTEEPRKPQWLLAEEKR